MTLKLRNLLKSSQKTKVLDLCQFVFVSVLEIDKNAKRKNETDEQRDKFLLLLPRERTGHRKSTSFSNKALPLSDTVQHVDYSCETLPVF